jgi:hypothetical protein
MDGPASDSHTAARHVSAERDGRGKRNRPLGCDVTHSHHRAAAGAFERTLYLRAVVSKTSLPDLLGVSEDHVDDNRLYRCLDKLLPHKEALEVHLKNRMGELFDLEYDLLMYDVTSTFFEGRADFPLAQRGYSRDQRSDCKQVCIALVVSKCGVPLGYEVFAGNTADVTTVEHIVEMMEARYGKSDRIWVMDRGMVSEDNIEFLRDGGRRLHHRHSEVDAEEVRTGTAEG